MSNLLQVSRIPAKVMGAKNTLPLYMEFKVSPEISPYLVSATKSVLWVETASSEDLVKAAVRKGQTPGDIFYEIVEAVVVKGREREWGNVHPFTASGIAAALAHVRDYELGDVEVLAAPFKKGVRPPDWLNPQTLNVPVRWTSWLPEGRAVVVPTNREFVGLLGHLGPKHLVFVVHNASRGIAVATTSPG